ncbi:MAG: methyltransferase domain-containing protein [Chloroflexaceae bacterium]|nr:methyltransferase domain-containing protein [Chloroflexaceae bacterium]
MVSTAKLSDLQSVLPVLGNINQKTPAAYQLTWQVIDLSNFMQLELARAYIDGLELPDFAIKQLCDGFLSLCYGYFPCFLVPYDWVLKESEALAVDPQVVMKIQYNLPETLFTTMLEADKLIHPKYSMALWEKGATTLRQAQQAMLEDLIVKADIQEGQSILDLGCGWGSAVNYLLAKFSNVKVTGLNLSQAQCAYIRRQMRSPHSHLNSGRFELVEADFNEVTFPKPFDRVISLGFFEHVANLAKAFAKVAQFMTADGQFFLHIITTRLPHNIWDPIIDRYIFPKARVWQYDAVPHCDRDLQTRKQWYLNGQNYAKTLKWWLKNFDRKGSKLEGLDYGIEFAKFRRLWRLYLLLCISHFERQDGQLLGNGQYLLIRK